MFLVKTNMTKSILSVIVILLKCLRVAQLALCTASLLPEFQPAPCFLSAIIGHIIQVCLTSVVTATIIRHT